MRKRLVIASGAAVLGLVVLGSIWFVLLRGGLVFQTSKICQATGTEDRERPGQQTGEQLGTANGGVRGTDLGFPFEHRQRLYLLFGDTVELNPDLCEPDRCGTADDQTNLFRNSQSLKLWPSRNEWNAWRDKGRDGAESIAWTPLGSNPDQCLPLTFETEPDESGADVYRPTRLNGQVLGRFETTVGAFVEDSVTYAFFTVRRHTDACRLPDFAGELCCRLGDPPEQCALGDTPSGGQAVLATSLATAVSPGGHFVQRAIVSTSRFQWVVPVVADVNQVPDLPREMSGRVVLIWGSGNEGHPFRRGYPHFAVAPLASLGNKPTWRFFGGIDASGKPMWGTEESDAANLPPFGDLALGLNFHKCVGEFSVRFIEGWQKWVMLYACGAERSGNQRGIQLRTADAPWGPWSPPSRILSETDAYCHFMHNQRADCRSGDPNPFEEGVRDAADSVKRAWGGEYAPFLLPSRYARVGTDETTLYFFMSTWNPYQVVQMKTRIIPAWRAPLRAQWNYVTARFLN